jgi:hypothetical protein
MTDGDELWTRKPKNLGEGFPVLSAPVGDAPAPRILTVRGDICVAIAIEVSNNKSVDVADPCVL